MKTNSGRENFVCEYLLRTYQPSSVILYGSRAISEATPHSDWDLYLLIAGHQGQILESLAGESLDITFVGRDVEAVSIPDEFDNTLISGRLLFDKEGLGKRLLAKAQAIYQGGRNLSPEDLIARKYYLEKLVGRMKDHQANPAIFFMRSGHLYREAIRSWYEVLHNRWQVFLSQAVREIGETDKDFYNLLATIHGPNPVGEKICAASLIITKLFEKDRRTETLCLTIS